MHTIRERRNRNTGNQRTHVERVDRAVGEHVGDVALDDQPREPFRDRRLADAGLAHVERVVLAAAAEDLDRAFDLELPADQRVDAAFLRELVEVGGVLLERRGAVAVTLALRLRALLRALHPQGFQVFHLGCQADLFRQHILPGFASAALVIVDDGPPLRQDGDIYYEDAQGILIWEDWGGIIRGKGRFLRSIMDQYNISIPLYITETSQLCGWCSYYPETMPAFYDMQANLAPRSFTRAIADGISGFIWYTLEGPGWLNCGLLDENQVPKPAYYSYQTLAEMIGYSTYIGPAAYGDGIEAYTFHKGAARIDIIFAFEDVSYTISVPQLNYIAAYDRFGTLITPTLTGSDYLLTIRYEPIYLVRTR